MKRTGSPRGLRPPGRLFSVRRRWAFRAGVALVPVVCLLAVEAALRCTGVGQRPTFFVPAGSEGREVLVDNWRFGQRFFPAAIARTPEPVRLTREKPAGTVRVFVFGESAAMGDPEPAFGLPRMLQAMLEAKFPGQKFEVINVAMTAINSHVIREIARDCTKLNGDVWVLYMGNNEVVGPFGGGTVFGPQVPGLKFIRLAVWFKGTRIGQLLSRFGDAGPIEWEGMEMFLRQQVRHDDPRLEKVYAHFRRNLDDIIALGANHGAEVILSTVAVNLRDCPPFASGHPRTVTGAEQSEWDREYRRAGELAASGRTAEACDAYSRAARLRNDSAHAELRYHLARCALGRGDTATASNEFRLANEYDALRFRADERINSIIREAGHSGKPRLHFVDTANALASKSTHGIPGEEFFYEHVHFTFDGAYEAARAIFGRVVELMPSRVTAGAREGVPTVDECARRLAWTYWNRAKVYSEVRQRLQQPPFSSQFGHQERDAQWQRRIDDLSRRLDSDGVQRALDAHRDALRRATNDWVLHENLARLCEETGDTAGAMTGWREVARLLPHDPQPHFHLGRLADSVGRRSEAAVFFRAALQRNPGLVEARNELALALAALGRVDEARRELELALKLRPRFTQGRINLGQLLAGQGLTAEARREYELALRFDTNNAAAHVNLGKLLADAGDKAGALRHYREAIRINPGNAVAHFNLGNALLSSARDEARGHYAEAARLNPDFAEARFALAQELARLGAVAEALPHFAATVRLRPELAEARFNFGVALAKAGQMTEAAAQFRETLRLQPDNAQARQFLERATTMREP